MCEKRLNNGYETHQAAFDSMVGQIGKLNYYNDHRIYEMLPLNVIVEMPATTTCLQVACLDLKKNDHTQNKLLRIE